MVNFLYLKKMTRPTHKNNLLLAPMLVVILLLSGFIFTANAAQISVQVDRNPVNLNESFQLIFSADASPDDDPDFSALESDFEIISQSQSSNISMINGAFSKNIKWTLKVIAKQAGVIQIPVIAFGSDSSQAVRLTVNKGHQNSSNSNPNDDIFIQVSADTEQAIIQSQIIYSLRIYRKVTISQARLTEPAPANALIERLGKDNELDIVFNGQAYQVIERKYAIFPQKSGSLIIDPIVLTVEVVTGNGRSFGGYFNRPSTRSKRIVSEPLSIDVLPIPTAVDVPHWLPAEHLYLEQKWSDDTAQLKAGEPITRTLTLLAKGTTLGQLPELNNSQQSVRSRSGGELKNYPDQPVLKEQNTADSMVAFREEKTAIIASKAGVYELPAIEVPWWDTRSKEMKFARIPATTLTAISATTGQHSTPVVTDLDIEPDQSKDKIISHQTSTTDNLWFWLSLFFGSAWFITLALWYAYKKTSQPKLDPINTHSDFNEQELKRACRENNPAMAKNELVKWGRGQWQLSNLGKIAQQCEPELQAAILTLNNSLYSQAVSTWQGGQLLSALKNKNQKTQQLKAKQQVVLQPLYKI